MFDINEYFQKKGRSKTHGSHYFDTITCVDGFNMSVQASEYHYCQPRVNYGPWINFEIGFPSQVEDLIMQYVEDPEAPTQTVYGYVPVETINEVIEKHGGIKK